MIDSLSDAKKLNIPAIVRVGVTGHRTLASEQLIRESVKSVLGKLDKMLRNTPHTFIAVSPLAEGADRLVAKEILAWQVFGDVDKPSLEAVLPLPEADYLQDFETQESRDEFRELLAKAKSIPPPKEAESIIREQIKLVSDTDIENLTKLLEKANDMMLRENQDWRVVFTIPKLEAP